MAKNKDFSNNLEVCKSTLWLQKADALFSEYIFYDIHKIINNTLQYSSTRSKLSDDKKNFETVEYLSRFSF